MFYSQGYWQATQTAAAILTEAGITDYPLNPLRLANQAGIRVLPFAVFGQAAGLTAAQLRAISADGFSARVNGKPLIAYDPAVTPRSRRRWTLLHEYCHIRLGHVPDWDGKCVREPDRRLESEANELALCLLAPLPLLLLCHIGSAAELAHAFGLSGQAAANVYADYRRYLRLELPPQLGYGDSLQALLPFVMTYRRGQERTSTERPHGAIDVCREE